MGHPPDGAWPQRIRDAGWRQASVFLPGEFLAQAAPAVALQEGELLIVATQSCTLLSMDPVKDPWVEVLPAKVLPAYQGKSQEAQGKMVRKFMLPLQPGAPHGALLCDINRRFFLPRWCLAEAQPLAEVEVPKEASRDLAGWLGRYYTRVALPDALVERIKPFLGDLGKGLRAAAQGGAPLHEGVPKVLISWAPDDELPAEEGSYDVKLLFLCEDDEVVTSLGEALKTLGLAGEAALVLNRPGFRITAILQAESDTMVGDLRGHVRFSEWDHLSSLGDLVDDPGA